MARRALPGTRPVSGIVLVDKPEGVTSNRVLQRVKRLFRAQKAGHTGTLDPMATGMLPVCLGAATRVSGLMLDASKRYRVTAELGSATDTGDATGVPTGSARAEEPARAVLDAAVASLRGQSLQVPPMYSAVHHDGKRLYELARQGLEVPRRARRIEVHEIGIESLEWPRVTLEVHCSKGTYVRTLVTDLAERLGTLGHVAALRRLSVGPFEESGLVGLDALEAAAEAGEEALDRWLLGADAALPDLPAVQVTDADRDALRHGRRVFVAPDPADAGLHAAAHAPHGDPSVRQTEPATRQAEASVRIYDGTGGFVGLGRLTEQGELRPWRIFPA